MEALRSSSTRVWDLVLERPNETSSLVASLSSVVELIEDCIDSAVINGVRWGTRSVLAAALLHFLELGTELELLGSGHNVDLMVGQVDAL
jgi:hypothetical protein